MKRFLSFLLAVSICLSVSACGGTEKKPADTNTPSASTNPVDKDSGSEKSPANTDEVPDEKQYYNTSISSDPTSMDVSLLSDSIASGILYDTMEGLIRLEGLDNGECVVAPGEAESWEVNEEGTVWTFHLREGLKWEDGVPGTANDYVYSIRRSSAPEIGCPNSFFLQPIKNFKEVNNGELPLEELGVKALDDRTLEITLSEPTPAFLQMITCHVYYPQREDKVKEWGEKYGSEAQYIISNGPFKMTEWVHNNSLTFVKNDQYWDAESVKLEKINRFIMGEQATSLNAFQSGELDVVGTSSLEWLDRFKNSGAVYAPSMSRTLSVMPFNTTDPLFSNINVRKAFGLVLDREELSDMCFNGLRLPCYGMIVPALTVGEKSYRDLAGEPVLEMQEELKAQGITPKDLLIQGMEELGMGSDPSTITVTLSLGSTSDWFKTLGEYVQQIYETELGVHCVVDQMEWAIFAAKLQKKDYQLGFMSWNAYYNDPYDVLSIFDSSFDGLNIGWSSEEYDRILKESAREMNEEKRTELYKQMENIVLQENFVASPIAYTISQTFYQPYVRGYDSSAFGMTACKYLYTVGRP